VKSRQPYNSSNSAVVIDRRPIALLSRKTDNRRLSFLPVPAMSDPHTTSEFKSRGGLLRVLNAARYSLQGLKAAVRGEHAFRKELMVIVPATVLALLVPVPVLEKLLLVGVLVLVLIVELINSAVEAAIDRISLERHPLSRNAKDFGSAAVALAVALAAGTWGVILLPLVFSQA
jgi:diacylglycerol kinase (ATP)